MPRKPRHIEPGAVYHFISRLTAREWLIADAVERSAYLQLFGHALLRSDWRSLAYAVMSNHVHHVLVAGAMPLAAWLAPAHARFAEWMNERRDRIGAVFVRGPKDRFVPPDAVAEVIAYVHNNPVRAGVAVAPHDSDWTSHPAYLGLTRSPPWLDGDDGLARTGFLDPAAFDAWVTLPPAARPDLDAAARERAFASARPPAWTRQRCRSRTPSVSARCA